MIVKREIHNIAIADFFKKIDESELEKVLRSYLKMVKPKLLKKGKQRAFKPFKAVKMKGEGPTASEMVIQGRL